MNITTLISEIEESIYQVYKQIHENPELGMEEHDTSRLIREELLKHSDCDEIKSIGSTGMVAILKGEKEGSEHHFLLRGDMDALPVQEDIFHAPRSKKDGTMHACGHDAHTAVLLGALRVLKNYKRDFSGNLYFFFQPAEETLGGAKLLLETKEIDLEKIEGVAACHVMPDLYAGDIGLKSGVMLASADQFEVIVTGKGGHGAHPYTTVDPIVIASDIVVQLQNLVSREVSALDSAVISICSIHSDGDAFNVIPNKVRMKGTLRALKKETRQYLIGRITDVCSHVARAGRGEAEVALLEGPPPFYNDEDWVERTRNVMEKLIGEEHVKMLDIVTMGAEDFAFIKDRYPGVFVRIGCRTPGKEFTPIHSSRFTVDRKALTTGMQTLCGIALDFLGIKENIYD
ncbi:M20 metallopeptidase family protein [Lacrimispora sp.]|uniref:M20 metallopeptidase family protein n=1 Tax=Lacrimispora sp. TaxID=2719234 RepID=UPI002FDADB90